MSRPGGGRLRGPKAEVLKVFADNLVDSLTSNSAPLYYIIIMVPRVGDGDPSFPQSTTLTQCNLTNRAYIILTEDRINV